ncbi:PepSY domain-containing protein [Saccharibacillus sp. CPCC 101409]|uniref:PepSY domain-containing protein n=1 Tax=Saccharibacillus sp. CPCC 101409 TaxID=3058041 RepID=UPI00267317CC|nr:PepSY domain-containing protein [Saccharibacillus sp. CPCC 101409]MDO3410251.1 PepSY domain-containing protein [Saccharibacillus sp. CPCC 101409]
MKRRTAAAAGIGLAAAAAALIWWSPWSGAEPALTADQAEQALLAQYPGNVESAERSGGRYEMTLRTSAGLYAVSLAAADGRIEAIRRLEAADEAQGGILGRSEMKAQLERRYEGAKILRLELESSASAQGGHLYAAEIETTSGERRLLELNASTGETLSEEPVSGGTAPGADGGSGTAGGSGAENGGNGGGDAGNPGDNGGSAGESESPGNGGTNPADSGGEPGGTDDAGGSGGKQPAKLLTEKQAERRAEEALAQAGSPVEDSDAELRTEDDGEAYYLVEIELENGREASVQVNAVSGGVQSITWEEDDS